MKEPLRRLAAFGIDYLLIAAYLGLLAAGSLAVLASPAGKAVGAVWSTAWSAEIAGFFLLTLPVILYFALSEASTTRGTLGKRVLHLRVQSTNGQPLRVPAALLRSAVKFLPWELAHFTIWHLVYAGPGGPSHGQPSPLVRSTSWPPPTC